MPVILSAIALALVIASVAGLGFYAAQEPVYRAQPMESVRVGDPGHNLVGPAWTGDPRSGEPAANDGKTGPALRRDSGT
jgi:hypothetical protein